LLAQVGRKVELFVNPLAHCGPRRGRVLSCPWISYTPSGCSWITDKPESDSIRPSVAPSRTHGCGTRDIEFTTCRLYIKLASNPEQREHDVAVTQLEWRSSQRGRSEASHVECSLPPATCTSGAARSSPPAIRRRRRSGRSRSC